MKNKILLSLILTYSMFNVYSQRNITPEEYKKIITTDAYYWGRSDFDLPTDAAKKQALEELINQISEFEKSIIKNDLMKKAKYVKFEVEGNRKRIICYLPKDSLYIEHIMDLMTDGKEPVNENKTDTVQRKEVFQEFVIENTQETEPEKTTETILPIVETKSVPEIVPDNNSNEIINTLSKIYNFNNFCVQLNRYKRQGKLYDSQNGKAPDVLENCIMAIFKNDVLEAIYDTGSISRKNLLTGETIQKPEDNYKNKPEIKVIFIKLN